MYFRITLMQKGKKTTQVYEASNKRSAVAKAKKEFPKALVVKTEETSTPLSAILEKILKDFKKSSQGKVKAEDKIAAIRQISVMTDAGISITDTLDDIAANSGNPRLKEIFEKISSDINAGKSMSQAMEPYAEEFGHVTMAMTNLGEKTGNFSTAFSKLAEILENVRDNTGKFKKALRYPITTLSAMGIAFVALIMLVVPKFKKIFEELHADLPVPTKILLALEYAFNHYGLLLLAMLFGGIYTFLFMYKNNPSFKYNIDRFIIEKKVYLISNVIFYNAMYSYTLVFGELVKAGIPISEALETAVGMVTNSYIKEKLETVNANIGRGLSLTEAYEQTGLFEKMLLQMIKAGEASGQLDMMVGKVSDYYNMHFQDIIENLSGYIEPIMMFFIAGLVLLLALGIFMPMWGLGSAVKKAG